MILRTILWIIVIYCIYKFVVHFVLPVFKVTRQMKKQVNEFQQRMQEQQENIQKNPSQETKPPIVTKAGEYIDFEEVKQQNN